MSVLARIVFLVSMTSLLASVPLAEAKERPTVAVLYFDYDGKDAELGMLRKCLAQLLIKDLAEYDKITVLERERLEALLKEIKLGKSGYINKQTAQKLGRGVGARYMVLGSYFQVLGKFIVNAKVVEVATGVVIRGARGKGKADDFMEISEGLSSQLAKILTGKLSKGDKARPLKRPGARKRPKRLRVKTAIRYGKALDAMDRGDRKAAKVQLKAALKDQPDFTLASLDLQALVK